MPPLNVEALTQAYGRDLFGRLENDRPLVFSPRWLDDQLMGLSMHDEALKVQMFRFIDVLPVLQNPDQITRHLQEYLGGAEALPAVARKALRWLPHDGWAGRMLAHTARQNARRMARRFIAGSNVPEAVTAIGRLRRQTMAFTIDLLGEAVLTEGEARQYQREYLDLVEGLTAAINPWPEIPQIDRDHLGPIPKVNVSIKLSALFSQFDPLDLAGTTAAVRERLEPILDLARRRGAFINIDMEQFAFKDATLHVFKEVFGSEAFRTWGDVGIAIQAYLRSCGDDLAGLAQWAERRGTPVWVRLVKGAYWDYETALADQNDWPVPVWTQKWQSDAHYETHTQFLLERHQILRPAIGSHNVRSIAHALAVADALNVPRRCLEFQLLYGMADPIKTALVGMGQRVRVYTPYGQLLPGMAYLVRRLLENTANQSFLRAGFVERVPEEILLMNPAVTARSAERGAGNGKAEDHNHALESSALRAPRSAFKNEPLIDFSQEPARQAFRQALDRVKGQLGVTVPLVIGGQNVTTGATLTSVNPSHQAQVVGRCASATADHARQAVEAAARAFPKWRDTPVEERAKCLIKAADLMRQRRTELGAWIVYESGKQWREADADVAEAIDFCVYYAQEMLKLAKPQRRDVAGEENEYFYDPKGVVSVIAPWNFPLAILTGMTAAALVTGNTAIMKPAEQTPIIAHHLMRIWQEAGVPAGVVNYLPGVGEEVGPVLVEHPEVAVIVFTGSRAVGLLINRQAAAVAAGQEHVKRVITEMGGKNATIIDDDADLDQAVFGVVASAFGYQGQKCSACSRAIVLAPIYDTFLNRLIDATRSLKVGPADDPGAAVGPVIDDEARQRILGYIAKGKAEAKLVHAADVGNLADEGFYVGPHVFADVAPTATIAQEEIFGPVLAVLKVADLDEALRVANGVPYALTGGLYSRSPANIARVRREFRVGNLYINRKITGALVDRQPFGGFKMSGIGSKAGGPDYLLQFVNPRTITENTMRHGFAPAAPASAVPGEGA